MWTRTGQETMAGRMSWGQCLELGIVKRGRPDLKKASRMLKMAHLRMRFWDRRIEDEFAALKVEAYYDVIQELVHAHLYRKGYNCSNHLCLISFLEENFRHFGRETMKIDELRVVRNDMNYKGLIVERDYLERNEREFRRIIAGLRERLRG